MGESDSEIGGGHMEKFRIRKVGIPLLGVCLALVIASPAFAHLPGRMTGGGSIMVPDVGRVTHGFELHCIFPEGATAQEPNNLEINWGGGQNFHLTTLTAGECSDNPNIEEFPPEAGFDVFNGSGTGTLNGVEGHTITFGLTDAGEPGTSDRAFFVIRDPEGNVVLDTGSRLLRFGNHQAHAT